MKDQTAFTLIELITVILLIAILTTYAVPNMRSMLINNRILTKTNQLIHAINYARSEAIIDVNKVIIIRNIEENWTNGWEIVDINSGGTTGQTVLKVFKFKDDDIDVVMGNEVNFFRYTSRGYLQNLITFEISNSEYPEKTRIITVRPTGRANTKSSH
ncbi:MAG: GspH/FimT family pseudopilin [Candidatus Marithrix sp.]